MMRKKSWKEKAKIEYETTNCTLAQIAQKYNKSVSSVRQTSAKEKWNKRLHKLEKEIEQKIEQSKQKIVQEKEEELEKIVQEKIDLNQKHIELAKIIIEKAQRLIDNLTDDEITSKELLTIESALEKNQKRHRLAEGLDKDTNQNVKEPEINIIQGIEENI